MAVGLPVCMTISYPHYPFLSIHISQKEVPFCQAELKIKCRVLAMPLTHKGQCDKTDLSACRWIGMSPGVCEGQQQPECPNPWLCKGLGASGGGVRWLCPANPTLPVAPLTVDAQPQLLSLSPAGKVSGRTQ